MVATSKIFFRINLFLVRRLVMI